MKLTKKAANDAELRPCAGNVLPWWHRRMYQRRLWPFISYMNAGDSSFRQHWRTPIYRPCQRQLGSMAAL